MANDQPGMTLDQTKRPGRLYAAIWRWHFYAGLIVAPYFLIAAFTGIVMTLKAPLEAMAYGDCLYVETSGEALSPEALLAALREDRPDADVLTYLPPQGADRSAMFIVAAGHDSGHAGHFGGVTQVYLDPYRGTVLGEIDPSKTLYAFAHRIHGTLYLGLVGDYLIEVAAGFGVLMLVTGLFLFSPWGGQSFAEAAVPRVGKLNRQGLRRLHGAAGFWIALVLLFFLISGLSWTPFWGAKFVQAWSGFPMERFAAPVSEMTHEAMNHGGEKTVAWAMEQTPMPMADHHMSGHGARKRL